ncbi:sigma-70 family RNA polymerase sigma factor [Microlunatus sp. GCM10028923]|uniref:sigma-70 family RNA polymerase sigma factor n=1 Tax=Microlunatus sp. GCM10028923 TaxID=3273400 RepID=UPI00360B9A0E
MGESTEPDEALLTPAEECELAARIEAGALAWAERQRPVRRSGATTAELLALERVGERARQRFVRANLGLVAGLVPGYASRAGLPRDELFQEGCLGLLIAVARFDHRRGMRFSTYALHWIRARLGDAVLRRCGGLPLPALRAEQLRAARVAEDELVQTLGRDVTAAEIATRAGLDPRRYERLLAWQHVTSLDLPAGDPGGPADLGPPPDAITERPERSVDELLWRLPQLEQTVLRLRYGLDGEPGLSYAAIATRIGQSESGVRRIEHRALDRLRSDGSGRAGTMTG